jgi:hypothetical protein
MNSTYVQCVFRVRYGEWCATHWGVGRTGEGIAMRKRHAMTEVHSAVAGTEN